MVCLIEGREIFTEAIPGTWAHYFWEKVCFCSLTHWCQRDGHFQKKLFNTWRPSKGIYTGSWGRYFLRACTIPVEGSKGGTSGKEPACQRRRRKRCKFDPWFGKIPWRRPWHLTLVCLPGESHGQRNLAGYSPRGHKELDMTEVTYHTSTILVEVETVTDFIFLGSQITTNGDCSQEIKRLLFLGRKAMTNLDSILKSRDIILLTKVHLVKAMVFPVVMYRCENWTIKKAECQRMDALNCGTGEDSWESFGLQRD